MTNHISAPCRWTFFESYARALDTLKAHDIGKAKDLLFAMYEYSSWGLQPDLDFNDPTVAMAWALVEPNLDSSVKNHTCGSHGGRAKAANSQLKGKENMMAMTTDDMKRVKKLAKAMGNVYEATTVPEYDEDALLPDWDFEAHSAFISEDDEREREMYRAECEAFEMLG